MQIERIAETRLTATDDRAIGQLLDHAFGIDFQGRSYFQNRHHVRFIVRDGASIIGHIALSLRAIRMGDTLVQVAGLAEVATARARRGKGIASALLQAAIGEAKESVAEFLVLFGDAPLYAGAGFTTKPNRIRTVAMREVRTGQQEDKQDSNLMVMQLKDTCWDDDAHIDLVGVSF